MLSSGGRPPSYREPSPPSPRTFVLEIGLTAQVAVLGGIIALVLALAIFALSGGAVVVLFVAATPGLAIVLGGAPHAHTTLAIAAEHFPPRTFAECADALRSVARELTSPAPHPIAPPPAAGARAPRSVWAGRRG